VFFSILPWAACSDSPEPPDADADDADDAAVDAAVDADDAGADGGGCHEILEAAGVACGAGPTSVVWVGAHPDDEALLAPLLGELCHAPDVRCSLLVATRGEGGSCGLDGGCSPDLASVRAEEMRQSATVLDAELTQWTLPNGGPRPGTPEGVIAYWSELRGGQDALVGEIAAELERLDPDVLLSFDPRHGDTCHEEHRALASLVLAAVDTLAAPPAAFFFPAVEKWEEATWGGYRAVCDDPAILVYDATRVVPELGEQSWQYLLEVMLAHASQFDLSYVGLASEAPPEARVVPLLPRGAFLADAPCYSSICP
jgi:LmbE family N-acetylglucosaminyl deacetylase